MEILLGLILGAGITVCVALIKLAFWTKNEPGDVKRPLEAQYRTLRAEGKEPSAQRRKKRTQYRHLLASHRDVK